MQVNLGFAGLCLFVPEFSDGVLTKMHAVMPSDPAHKTHLVFDAKAPLGLPHKGQPSPHHLEKWSMDLTHLGTTPPLKLPTAGVADLRGCTGFRKIGLSDFDAGGINARVTFSAGIATIPPCARGAHWRFGHDDPIPLAIRVVWAIEIAGETLDVEIPDASAPGGRKSVTLWCDPDKKELDLWVFHSPKLPKILPPHTNSNVPAGNPRAEHFHVYLELLGCPGEVPTLDHFEEEPGANCYDIDKGLDVMCIAAIARLID